MTIFNCEEQWTSSLPRALARRLARLHRLVHVHSPLQQRANNFRSTVAHSKEERREARIRQQRMNVCSGVDQQIDSFGVTVGGSPHESSLSTSLLGIDVGTAL